MGRLLLHLVVLIGFLANQLAMLSHAHECGAEHDHALGHHFHLTWFVPTGDHVHAPVGADGWTCPHVHEHDADAIYCMPHAGLGSVGSHRSFAHGATFQSLMPAAFDEQSPLSQRFIEAAWHPPDPGSPQSEFLLELRALRI